MKVWLLCAWRTPVVFSSENGSGLPRHIQQEPSSRFQLLSAVGSVKLPLWAQSRHLNILARILVSTTEVDTAFCNIWLFRLVSSNIRRCSLTLIRYIHRFVQRTLANREGNVTYTWWLQGQIVFDRTRQPGNFTRWQAKVLKMIGQNSAQAVKCALHNYHQESYCCAVVLWWSDML